jgi:protein MpaA
LALGALVALAGGSSKRAARPPSQDRDRAAPAAVSAPILKRYTIGRSVQGRRIDAFTRSASGATAALLVVGCIDGNEPAGIAIARRLMAVTPPPRSALWIVPDLNPDGVAAATRVNANGVDLNRNFRWHWRPLGPRGDPQYAGPYPLSEPESRAGRGLILRVRPRITIWFHQPAALVDLSGGKPRIEREFARLVGLAALQLTRYPGSAVSWGNSVLPGTTAFVAELPAGRLSSASVSRYTRAVLTLAAGAARR